MSSIVTGGVVPDVTFTTGAQVGLPHTELSARTGVSQRYISELERGKSDLTISRLRLLTQAL